MHQVIATQTGTGNGMHQIITPQTIIGTDLDGTLLPLLHDPRERRIDAIALEALEKFNTLCPNQVIPITGRDWEQVVECFGKRPLFPVISSNGAQLHLPDGSEHTHKFTAEEKNFVAEMRTQMEAFKKLNPGLVTEVKRFEIGFHSSPASGFEQELSQDQITYLAADCASMMEQLERRAEKIGLDFKIAGTEITHHEMSCRCINKLASIQEFGPKLPTLPQGDDWSHVVYIGDCFLKGNDRDIAIATKQRGGTIIQVTNHMASGIPPKGDPAHPDMTFASAAELGLWIKNQIATMPAARPQSGHNGTPALSLVS